jgi:cytochrome c biogenesis DsbD-like protein
MATFEPTQSRDAPWTGGKNSGSVQSVRYEAWCRRVMIELGSFNSIKSMMRTAIILTALTLNTAFSCPASADGNLSGATAPAPAQGNSHFAGTADHVRIVSVARVAGDEDGITVTVVIDPGYHINANPASYKSLIPTTLSVIGYELKRVIYPRPTRFIPKFAEEAIDVYQGTEQIIVLFRKGAFPQDAQLRGEILAQACTDEICLPPAEITFSN